MATREDFQLLADTLGVTLSPESLRFTRSLDRADELDGDHIVMGHLDAESENRRPAWLLASKRVVETRGVGAHRTYHVTGERCGVVRYYASFRPDSIPSEFVEWPTATFERCCWLLET